MNNSNISREHATWGKVRKSRVNTVERALPKALAMRAADSDLDKPNCTVVIPIPAMPAMRTGLRPIMSILSCVDAHIWGEGPTNLIILPIDI